MLRSSRVGRRLFLFVLPLLLVFPENVEAQVSDTLQMQMADRRCMTLRCHGRLWNTVALYLDAPSYDRPRIWIDRNGNGRYDPGIDVPPGEVTFGEWREYFFAGAVMHIFGGVAELQCDYSDPMELDVSGNPALERLNCEGNRLMRLDVSKNEALLDLNCNNNLLDRLDLQALTRLERLQCAGNELKVVDLSKNGQLKDLDLSYNHIKSFNPHHTPLLERLDVVDCGLTSIDVTPLTNLRIFDCAKNRLKRLNLRENPHLELLNCRENQLSHLDVSRQHALTRLICHSNRLDSLTIAVPAPLVHLDCHNNRLSYGETAFLVTSLPRVGPAPGAMIDPFEKQYPHGLFYVQSQRDGNAIAVSQITLAREKGWRVQTRQGDKPTGASGDVSTPTGEGVMYLTFVPPDSAVSIWLEAEVEDQNRVWIDLDNNGRFDKEVDIDANTLQYGEWRDYQLRGAEVRIYGRVTALHIRSQGRLTDLLVRENPMLRELGCSGGRLRSLDLRSNERLEVLACSGNLLTMLDLSENTALRELHCSANSLTALALGKNRKLEYLACANNRLLALVLTRNRLLKHLNCTGNRISRLDLRPHTLLEELICPGNGMQILRTKSLPALRYVNVIANRLRYESLAQFVDAVPDLTKRKNEGITGHPERYGRLRLYVAGDGNELTTDLEEYAKAKGWKLQ